MILRNHGLLTAGRNIPEAFGLMVQLDKACEIQIAAQGGGELTFPSQQALDHAAETFKNSEQRFSGAYWSALLRLIKDQQADYAS